MLPPVVVTLSWHIDIVGPNQKVCISQLCNYASIAWMMLTLVVDLSNLFCFYLILYLYCYMLVACGPHYFFHSSMKQDFQDKRLLRSFVNIHEQENYSREIITEAVENCMKKQADNLVHSLEVISGRLSQLELYCYKLKYQLRLWYTPEYSLGPGHRAGSSKPLLPSGTFPASLPPNQTKPAQHETDQPESKTHPSRVSTSPSPQLQIPARRRLGSHPSGSTDQIMVRFASLPPNLRSVLPSFIWTRV